MIRAIYKDGKVIEFPTAVRTHNWEGKIRVMDESSAVIKELEEADVASLEAS